MCPRAVLRANDEIDPGALILPEPSSYSARRLYPVAEASGSLRESRRACAVAILKWPLSTIGFGRNAAPFFHTVKTRRASRDVHRSLLSPTVKLLRALIISDAAARAPCRPK